MAETIVYGQTQQALEIPQGEVVRGITADTVIIDNMGPCVLGIAFEPDTQTYIAGHIKAGEIVPELKALAQIGGGTVSVSQTKVEASVKEIYDSGHHLTAQQAKRIFRSTDRSNLSIRR